MELIINIHKKDYQSILNSGQVPYSVVCAIMNGTPLPKGHGDLKDADIYKAEVKKYITENKNSDDLYLAGCGDGAYHALHIFNCIPTIIEANGGEEE